MLFIRSRRTLGRVTTTHPALLIDLRICDLRICDLRIYDLRICDLRICDASVRRTPFLFHSGPQVPQSDLGAVPATCLLKEASQVILDHGLWCLNRGCDLGVCASLRKKRCDSP